MTKITLHDSQDPFTPNRDRAAGFYAHRDETPPADDYAAIKEALRSEMHAAEPEQVEVPMFLQTPEPEVMDVLAEANVTHLDSYERVNEAILPLYAQAKGSAELARGYGGTFNGRSVVEWERKAQSINESIRWNAGRRVETI